MSEILNEPASDNRPAIDEFLRAHGAADMPHPGGTLLQHLNRVSRRLADWGAPPEVQTAGLCHATYGTDGFAPSLLNLADRRVLVDLIGERPEALVHLYASCDRAVTYPRLRAGERPAFRDRFAEADLQPVAEDLRAFLEITAANELDVFEHNADLAARYGSAMYRLLEPVSSLLSAAAWDAVRRELGGGAAL
ncbi:DUF6817 domain-containing protein [Catenulispora rubra]|uniref:DUF6817 domain-containing protein n=1 Tax=Catenulispora rubra TaxID=280293 RepID=UPI00189239ED|nr:hypothetical protein [Catenulispora rubra]